LSRRNTVDVSGVRELQRDLRRLGEAAKEAKAEAARKWAEAVADDARADIPVDSGLAKSSLAAVSDEDSAAVGVWNPDAYYASMVEHGTESMAAQPYLVPAFERHTEDPARFLRAEIERRMGP
jgi:HK97 gp10 family phage protein